MPVRSIFREAMKTVALAGAALLVVTVCAVELEAWAVRNSDDAADSRPLPVEQGRLIRSHTVDQPTVGIIT